MVVTRGAGNGDTRDNACPCTPLCGEAAGLGLPHAGTFSAESAHSVNEWDNRLSVSALQRCPYDDGIELVGVYGWCTYRIWCGVSECR